VILKIPEKQIVIISVTEGSVIVELGFLRLDAAQASPNEIVLRLKTAATSGELDVFGLMALSVGEEKVIDDGSSSLSAGAIVGAVLGSLFGALILAFVTYRLYFTGRAKVHPGDSEMIGVSITGPKWGSNRIAPAVPPTNFTVIQNADLIRDLNVVPQSGSFGEVFKCDWRGTPVAVKKIMRVADRHKFVQEAQMMHSIQHPNCVRLYGVCEAPYPALVMEWMGGGDLLQFFAQRPLPQIHRRLSLFRQICAGLNSLHSHSPDPIIHSDLKPENILLDSDQKVAKIADFGLSKIKSASYAGSSVMGTILYFAPEMLLHAVPSHRPTDVYAMGLMLWEMLAGKLVWRNPDGSPFLLYQLNAVYNRRERPPLKELPAGIDPAIIALMQECWAQDPDQRPTAHELWRRMSALDTNNPEHNKPLELYPNGFVPTCSSLEECLRLAVPADVFNGMLLDMPLIDGKYRDKSTRAVVQMHGLSEVEAKCIIMYTHSQSLRVPDHPRPLDPSLPKRDNQFYFLFNKACRERDAATIQRFQNFSFHFISALNKLPNFLPNANQNFYRGFGQRLEEMNDLYRKDSRICWFYTSSSSMNHDVAYKNFAREKGTLMVITGIRNSKDIQPLSMIPSEGELLILPNTEFKVKLALSCNEARLLNESYAKIPDNVDLVILEAIS
jgi:serine/threonine protein kinase